VVRGLVRVRRPEQYSLPARANFEHLNGLLETCNGRLFIAWVGRNSDVHVLTRKRVHFKWDKMYWSMTDRSVLITFLSSFGVPSAQLNALASLVSTIADLRFGALILIAADPQALPVSVGNISSSPISKFLHESIRGRTIEELMRNNSAIGVLTSDGLTAVDRNGVVLTAGEIIDLSGAKGESVSGGGRTQAARAASSFGLAIKISEDGPITLFQDGVEIMRLVG